MSSSPGPLPDGATRVASWNVNSLRVRLPHVLDWLATAQPDLLGLQETKLVDAKFPQAEIEAAGYAVHFIGQPTYNGVAILARQARFSQISDVMHHDARLPDDQRRLTALTVTEANTGLATRFICVYVPNGSEVGSDKYRYKLAWLDALEARLTEELAAHPRLALVGDFNIAPLDLDVHDPAAWQEKILCSTPEREAFERLIELGLTDTLRAHAPQEESLFSWWDYRQAGFRRNLGLRIDHILLSEQAFGQCRSSGVDRVPRGLEQPSDHAPVWADIL